MPAGPGVSAGDAGTAGNEEGPAAAFGKDAHTDLDAEAAAPLHPIARSRALTDGNKMLALATLTAFCGLNG